MDRKSETATVVVVGGLILALLAGLRAAEAAPWAMWVLIVFLVPVAVLASLLIFDRVRRG